MSLEPPVLPDHWNASPSEDSPDLEKQCHSRSVKNRETLWGRIWRMLLSLVFKTETSVALSSANGNGLSTSNTRVSSDRLALDREIVTQTHLVEPVAIDMDSLDDSADPMQAKSDSQSILPLKKKIRVHLPPPPPPPPPNTPEPYRGCLLSDPEIAASPKADSNLASTPNTGVPSDQPTIETLRKTNLAEPPATYTDLPTFDKTIRIGSRPPSPPPPSDTLEDPCQEVLLSCSELDELVLLIESVGYISPRMSSSEGSTAKRDSTAIPPSLYQPHPEVFVNFRLLITNARSLIAISYRSPNVYTSGTSSQAFALHRS